MPKMITTAFHMVHLVNFFTAGPDEVKAWTIRKGFKAPQAAGVIHTDFEKGQGRASSVVKLDILYIFYIIYNYILLE